MFYNARNKKIQIENQIVDYITFGTGNKTLIMIPGLGDGVKTVKGTAIPFALMYKKFAHEYKVYVFSRRQNIQERFSTENMASDIVLAMDKLNIQKADIIGISQGGMIAQYIAINNPDKVRKLVLAVTSSKPNDILKNAVKSWINLAEKRDFKSILIDIAEKAYTEDYLKKHMKMYSIMAKYIKIKNPNRFIIQANSCLEHNAYDKLNKINCPTLIIGAQKDKTLGVNASIEMSKQIKNSELYIYEKYSHAVYEEEPSFNDKVLNFLLKQN